ncbi:MAG: AbrB/MazE/SpoVT family DNA-binding domain-containing protein [Verrucomicrobiota bacterium]|nr:AbrB/MazE/SpoVT family DNA-binding domain-containing protein [Verrucomicrobiota bacterium]
MNSVVSEKGQITIPKAVRDRLGLRAGTVLEIDAVNGRLVANKAATSDVLGKWRGRGKLPAGKSVDEYLKRTRGC